MLSTRRSFLKQTTGAIAGFSILPRPLLAVVGTVPELVPPIEDPRLKELVQRGLDTTRQAGAIYADVRLTYTRERVFRNGSIAHDEFEWLHVGVRALVDGYWGFAAGPLWHPDEMVRLGREAAQQARVNSIYQPRDVQLPPVDGDRQGHWETPVRIDAFRVHPQEIRDYMLGIKEQMTNEVANLEPFGIKSAVIAQVECLTWIQEKAFGSTDGRYYTQRLHRTGGFANVKNLKDEPDRLAGHDDYSLMLSGRGWEAFVDTPILDTVRSTLLEFREMQKLPLRPLDVGKYHTVFDAYSMAHLLSPTIGAATQIDRAMGYEANAGGTSYLNAPEEMLDTFVMGTPQLTVTANRGETAGLATARWDDEGVVPQEVTLVEKGVLRNFQTSREGASWLRDTYARTRRPVTSGGYLFANTAIDAQLVHTGNLVMRAGSESLTLKDLEAGVEKGMSVVGLTPTFDFQLSGGIGRNFQCYELRQGKRVARIPNAGVLFKTSEIWKGLLALGGASSTRRYGISASKGEPAQQGFHSATAVPAVIGNVSFIDPMRR